MDAVHAAAKLAFLLAVNAVLAYGAPGGELSENEKARSAWMAGYRDLQAGEQAESADDINTALACYGRAMERFLGVRDHFPQWNPSLITYRIDYCRDRIGALEGVLPSQATRDVMPPSAIPVPIVNRRLQESQEALAAMNQRMAEMKEQLAEAQAGAAMTTQLASENKAILLENAALADKNLELTQRVDALTRKLTQANDDPSEDDAILALGRQLDIFKHSNRELVDKKIKWEGKIRDLTQRNKTLSLEREGALERARMHEIEAAQNRAALAAADKRMIGLTQRIEKMAAIAGAAADPVDAENRLQAAQDGEQMEMSTSPSFSSESELNRIQDANVRLRDAIDRLNSQFEDRLQKQKMLQTQLTAKHEENARIKLEYERLNTLYQSQVGVNRSLAGNLKDRERDLIRRSNHTGGSVVDSVANHLAAPAPPPPAATDGAEAAKSEVASTLKAIAEFGESFEPERLELLYRRVLALDPEHRDTLERLGHLQIDMGDDEGALVELDRLFYLEPDNIDNLLTLGYVLTRTGKSDMAISMLSRSVALQPNNSDAHRMLGVAYATLGNGAAAETQFKRSFAVDAGNAEAAYNLAVLYAGSEPPRINDARSWYTTAIKLGADRDTNLDRLLGH